jgi:hypothetical protein
MKGRHWLAFWLFFFLGILAWVVARQTASVVLASQLREKRAARSALEGSRADLLGRIRTASSRAVLIPRAQARGLRLPADSEIIILQVPNPEIP